MRENFSKEKKNNGTVYKYFTTKNQIKFKGSYLNGKKCDGIGYDINGNIFFHFLMYI